MKNWINWVILAAILIIGVPTVTSAWYTVDQGQEAVLLRTGAIVGTEGPGLHFKAPWIDSVRYVSLQSHFIDYDEESYSRDQQPAQVLLLPRRRRGEGIRVRLGVDGDVAQEALGNGVVERGKGLGK